MGTGPFRRALIIRGGALGDFLLTLPTIASLRAAAPDAHIEVLAYPGIAALAADTGIADAVRPIEYAPLARFFVRDAVPEQALRDYFASFDTVISYLYDPDLIFADNLRAAGIKRLIHGPHKPGETSHAIDQIAAPLTELGIPFAQRSLRLKIPVSMHPVPIVALHPGSGSPRKNWPAANWVLVASALLRENPGLRIAVIGGEADGEALAEIRQLSACPDIEWWTHLPLPDLAAKLSGAAAYLGHDTGISHLAALCGVPSLLLFGPTDPGVWAPPHDRVSVLRAPGGDLGRLAETVVSSAACRLVSDALLASPPTGGKNVAP